MSLPIIEWDSASNWLKTERENSRYFAMPLLVSVQNEVQEQTQKL